MFVSDAYRHPMWYPHISLRYKASLKYAHTTIPLQARTPPFALTMLRLTSL